jgi:hypothetical protein
MDPIGKLKLCTGLQLAATLVGGVIAINVICAGGAKPVASHSLLWIGGTMSMLFLGCLGKFLYAVRRLPNSVCVRTEAHERSVTPWLSPEV